MRPGSAGSGHVSWEKRNRQKLLEGVEKDKILVREIAFADRSVYISQRGKFGACLEQHWHLRADWKQRWGLVARRRVLA